MEKGTTRGTVRRADLKGGQSLSPMTAGSRVAAMSTRHAVLLLPGGVLPAEPAYAALLQMLGERVTAVAKDLELYSADQPPPGYSLDTEIEGILREAHVHGFDRFHL